MMKKEKQINTLLQYTKAVFFFISVESIIYRSDQSVKSSDSQGNNTVESPCFPSLCPIYIR